MLVGEVDPQTRAKEVALARSKYLKLAGEIDKAWREMRKPATAAASDFKQVIAEYSRDTVTRAKRRLQIKTDMTNDPISGFVSYPWSLPQ